MFLVFVGPKLGPKIDLLGSKFGDFSGPVLVDLGLCFNMFFLVFGGYFSSTLRAQSGDLVPVFAVLGGLRPPEAGSRRGPESSSILGPIFKAFRLNFGVQNLLIPKVSCPKAFP